MPAGTMLERGARTPLRAADRIRPSRRVQVWLTAALALYCAALLALMPVVGAIPQDPAYHLFADQRVLFGIAHARDVLTNLAFIAAGLWGLVVLSRPAVRRRGLEVPAERWPWLIFFAGFLLTGVGSGYYHLRPDNASLLWDRLPMTLTTAGFVAGVVADRISPRAGVRLLWPLLAAGLLSVLWWGWSEHLGAGDLRPYALFQFGPLLPLLVLVALFPSRYTHASGHLWTLALFGAAKLAEYFDHGVYAALVVVSGHNLKHLLAAAAGVCVVRMLQRRQLLCQVPTAVSR